MIDEGIKKLGYDGDLYAWKLAHREGVELLKKQVDLFIDRFDGKQDGQLDLF